MRRHSRRILNCVGGSTAADGDDDLAFPNPSRRTPDHPPYSEMVSVALEALAEDNGSTESSISAYIQATFDDLPWGHDRLLPYYLRKLVAGGEITSPSPDRYQLSLHVPPSASLPVRRRGRPRLHHSNPNPNPNPRFSPLAAAARQQGRARMHRRRGRPPKIHSEDTPRLHLEQGAPLLRRGRGRGRSRRGRGDYIGRMAMRRLSLGVPRSRGLKRRLGSFLDSNNEELNCQFENSALLDGVKNGGSEYGVLVDSENIEFDHAGLEQGQPFVALEQSEVGKGQFLGENTTLLILEPGRTVPLLGSKHQEHGEGQMLLGEEPPFLVPEKTEFNQDQSLLGEKQPLLAPAPGTTLPFLAPKIFGVDQGQSMEEELPPFVAPEQTKLCQDISRSPFLTTEPAKRPPILAPEHFEHAQGQLVQEEAHPFVAPEQTELGQDRLSSLRERTPLLTSEQAKVPPFLAPENLEHDQGQQRQGEAPPFMPHEKTVFVQKQPSEEHPLLSPKQPEHDHGRPLEAPEESEEGHEQSLPGVETADFKEGELVLIPCPDEEEVENAAASSKKRKSHGKRRSLRLWFES